MSRGIPGVPNTIRAMLDDFDQWKVFTDTPTDAGVSVAYTEHYIYIGPDGRPVRTTRDEIEAPGPDGKGPPPGRYEIHIFDSEGKEAVDPFVGEQFAFDELSMSRRPGDAASSAFSTVVSELETALRNTASRLRDAERREEKYRKDWATVIDQNAILLREKGMLSLRTEKAEGDAAAAKEEAKLLRDELTQLREETAMFKPHAQMLVDEGMQYLARALGFSTASNNLLPSANDGGGAPAGGDPMPVGVGAEDPLGLFNKFFAATLMSPYFCKYIVENGHMFMPQLTWADIRGLIWANTKRDPGASPDWDRMIADYEAELSAAAAE